MSEIGKSISLAVRRVWELLTRAGKTRQLFPSLGISDWGLVLALWSVVFVLAATGTAILVGVVIALSGNVSVVEAITYVLFTYLAVPVLVERALYLTKADASLLLPSVGIGIRTVGNTVFLGWLASLPLSLLQEMSSESQSEYLALFLGSAGRGAVVSIAIRVAWGPVLLCLIYSVAEFIENSSFIRRSVDRPASGWNDVEVVELVPENVVEDAQGGPSAPIPTELGNSERSTPGAVGRETAG